MKDKAIRGVRPMDEISVSWKATGEFVFRRHACWRRYYLCVNVTCVSLLLFCLRSKAILLVCMCQVNLVKEMFVGKFTTLCDKEI